MNTYINPTILLSKGIKNKQREHKIIIDNEIQPQKFIIKARDAVSGKSRGIVGVIKKDGFIDAPESVKRLITPQIKQKISFALEMIFNEKTPFLIKS